MSTASIDINPTAPLAITASLADVVAGLNAESVPDIALDWARHALLDWTGVAIAGAHEPLVDLLIEEVDARAAGPDSKDAVGQCAIVGRKNLKSSPMNAALVNGAMAHALDYDDVNKRLTGHPTVVVTPVALALAERHNATGRDVLSAIVAGTEISCLLGEMAGDGHYEAGYHATSTIGTLGAAAAAAVILKLNAEQIRHAFGIAASQMAGLKSNFGTMTKPLHAGKAAMNGLLAARLAARGFTANDAIVECKGGIADAMMPGFHAEHAEPHPAGYFAIQQTLFKYNAACYLTHSSIEAVKILRETHNLNLDDVKEIAVCVRPSLRSVCDIVEPKTGLEIKFSIRHCVVLALDGIDTGALDAYSDANAVNPRYVAARTKTTVEDTTSEGSMSGTVRITLNDGTRVEQSADVSIPATNLDDQWRRLNTKFDSLCTPLVGSQRSGEIATMIESLHHQQDIQPLMALISTPSR